MGGAGATSRRIGLAAACLMLLPSGTTQAIEDEGDADASAVAMSEATADYHYRFLSSPDFLNADIGNTRKSALFRPGDPNSTNKRYEQALDTVLDSFAEEYETGAPRDIFVAGDLVNGHWGIDTDDTGLFGPTKTYRQRLRAVERAGALYDGQWLDRFERRGLTPYAALGDHEIGDDPWGRPGDGGDRQRRRDREFKLRAVPVFKETFSKHILRDSDGTYISRERPRGPAHDTAYAVRPHPEVQLVTLDVFQRTDDDVVAELDPKQLSWLRKVLRAADRDGVDWTIVQGHTPIAGPVRMRGSSGLMYRAGTRSQLWEVLETENVDLYLAGEVHDITAHQPRARRAGPDQSWRPVRARRHELPGGRRHRRHHGDHHEVVPPQVTHEHQEESPVADQQRALGAGLGLLRPGTVRVRTDDADRGRHDPDAQRQSRRLRRQALDLRLITGDLSAAGFSRSPAGRSRRTGPGCADAEERRHGRRDVDRARRAE